MSFKEEKQQRKKLYYERQYGWKERKCMACNGSGIYDHNGSPPCGACDGTGKETYRGPKSLLLSVTSDSPEACEDYCVHGAGYTCGFCHKYKNTRLFKEFKRNNPELFQ